MTDTLMFYYLCIFIRFLLLSDAEQTTLCRHAPVSFLMLNKHLSCGEWNDFF